MFKQKPLCMLSHVGGCKSPANMVMHMVSMHKHNNSASARCSACCTLALFLPARCTVTYYPLVSVPPHPTPRPAPTSWHVHRTVLACGAL